MTDPKKREPMTGGERAELADWVDQWMAQNHPPNQSALPLLGDPDGRLRGGDAA